MAAAQDLLQRRSRLTPAQRALLEKRLSGGRGGRGEPAELAAAGEDEGSRITPRPGHGPAPLSWGESRLWHFARRRPQSGGYNLYHAVAPAGRPSPLPAAAALQAADFAAWQRRRIAAGALAADLAWWRQHLAGAAPAGPAWPARLQAPGGRSTRLLAAELSEALKALAQRERATLFVTLLAGFQAALHLHRAETGVILGIPMALRGRPEAAGIVGCLRNLLALRPDLGGDPTFAELLRRVRDTFLGAFTHREAPIEWLARELAPQHDPGAVPWITVLFNMPSGGAGHAEPLRVHGVELAPLLTGEVGSELDLTFHAREVPGGLRLDLGYNANVLAPGEPERLLAGFATLLEEAAAHPGRRLSELAGTMATPVLKGN